MSVDAPVRALDRFQQRHGLPALVFAVVKKFGDDRGSALAALITYYGFLALFPLLLILYTVLGFVLVHDPSTQARLERSVFGQFPVIGTDLQRNVGHGIHGNVVALVVGLVGLLWGALGVTQVVQHAFHEVWSVPGRRRPNFLTRLLRSASLFGVLGLGVAVTTGVSGLGSALAWGRFGSVLAALPAALANIALFLLAFRLLSPPEVSTRQLLPGVVLAGVGWQVLQTVGVNLVSHQLRHASQVYGVFGFTLALLSFLFLAAQLTLYGAELNVVLARRLWPRSIVQPPLTGPDMEALRQIAGREERRPEERVHVEFEPAATGGPDATSEPD